jgi:hypothetical protein
LRMRRGYATVSVRQNTRFVDAQQTRVAKTQGAGFLGWRAASPRVVSIIIWTDAVAPMPNIPGWNRVRSEVGRTPNSATPPQSTCCRLPEDETGQIQTRSGPSEKRGFGKRRLGLTYCIAWRQVSGWLRGRWRKHMDAWWHTVGMRIVLGERRSQ